jgi:hypothetical protein
VSAVNAAAARNVRIIEIPPDLIGFAAEFTLEILMAQRKLPTNIDFCRLAALIAMEH